MTGGDDIAGVHTALGDGGLQGGPQRAVETVSVGARQAVGAGGGDTFAFQSTSSASRFPTPAILV